MTAPDDLRRLQADVEHLLDVGRPDEARAAAVRLLAAAPDDPAALCLLARALLALRLGVEAEAAARQAVALAPDGEWGHRLLSMALVQQGRARAAVPPAREATRLEPQLWQTWTALASASIASGDHPGAITAAREAVRLGPDAAATHFVLGQAYAPVNPWAAGNAYRRALALDPQDAGIMNGLAALELQRGRTLSAADGFVRTGAMDPRAGYVWFNLKVTVANLARRIHLLAFGTLGIQWFVLALEWEDGTRSGQLQWAGLVLAGLSAAVLVAGIAWRRSPPGAVGTLARVARTDGGLLGWLAAGLAANVAAAVAAVLFLVRPRNGPGAVALAVGSVAFVAVLLFAARVRRAERRHGETQRT